MGDLGPRGAINMGGRDLKQKASVTYLKLLWDCICYLWCLLFNDRLFNKFMELVLLC